MTAAWLLAALSVCAGVGVLYLLRSAHALAFGPRVGDALPLQQLARSDGQPLARVAAAWIGAGLTAGLVLGSLTRLRAAACALAVAAIATVVLVAAGAGSDAVESSLRFLPQLTPQLGRAGLIVAVALMLVAAYPAARAAARDPSP